MLTGLKTRLSPDSWLRHSAKPALLKPVTSCATGALGSGSWRATADPSTLGGDASPHPATATEATIMMVTSRFTTLRRSGNAARFPGAQDPRMATP